MARPKAYFINGGAGRVISSIPAFEKLAEVDDDFIIVCEGGSEMFRGHPVLHRRVFDHWHKGLFHDKLKDRDIVSPEPYRVWEYYNQKCSIAQAFDIEINGQGIRELPPPTLRLSQIEIANAHQLIMEIKERTRFDKVIVVQPFGRTTQNNNGFIADPTGRSFMVADIVEIINELKKSYGVMLMSEFPISFGDANPADNVVGMPRIPDLRIWAACIELADHFIGCDSVGQHMARALGKTATVAIGSTFPINVSYPGCRDFDIVDLGKDSRIYSPIRISMEDEIDRMNESCMALDEKSKQQIIQSAKSRLGKSTKFVAPEPMPEPAMAPISGIDFSNLGKTSTDADVKVIGMK